MAVLVFLGIIVFFLFLFFTQSRQAVVTSGTTGFGSSSAAVALPPLTDFRNVRAIYATAKTVAIPARLDQLIALIKGTELNALIVDLKDSDGTPKNETAVVQKLLANGIYPIARLVVFQDDFLATNEPNLALRQPDGSFWPAPGKPLWVDPSSRSVWDYNLKLAEAAFRSGFKEINLDYVRFPSDGATAGIRYPFYNASTSESGVIEKFFRYFSTKLKAVYPQAVLSVDLFAFSFVTNSGLGVGQKVPVAAQYFDVLCPMIYPSHYGPSDFGFMNPAAHPYDVVSSTLVYGEKNFGAALAKVTVRPWIQGFNLGDEYTPALVREEIRAITDNGLGNHWMVWNPANVYDSADFLPKR